MKLFNVDGLLELTGTNRYEFKLNDINDVFNAAGQILKLSQELEQTYKKYAELKELNVKNLQNSSLNKINNELNKEGNGKKISDKVHDELEKVILVKNYFMHEFFLKDFQEQSHPNGYDAWLADLSEKLTLCYNYICEMVDCVNNMIEEAQGKNQTRRPTIWDKK